MGAGGSQTQVVIHIQLLGSFKITHDERLLSSLMRPRMQALLAYLLLRRNMPQSRAHLAYTFWPDSTEQQARTNLRRELSQLRRKFPQAQPYLQIETQSVLWRSAPGSKLDVADFLAALDDAGATSDPTRRLQSLETAVALYQGDLLPGLYEEWLLAEREELAQRFVQSLEQLVVLHSDERNYAAAIQAGQRLLRYDPLYEAGYLHLMELYAAQNQRARALHTYHTCAAVLERELGVTPSTPVQTLYERLYTAEDIAEAEGAPRAVRATAESMQLVGRGREWRSLLSTWRRASAGNPQFVLIEGEAGMGKTRLAEELLSWVSRQGVHAARARSYAAEGGLAYAPIIDWLRSDSLAPLLTSLDPVWQSEVARLLPELLTSHPHIPPPQPLTEGWQRQRLFEALARVFTTGRQAKLLLLDDLQWSDQETLEWLGYLLRFDANAPLLLVGTLRLGETDHQHPLHSVVQELRIDGTFSSIRLAPLSAAETSALGVQVSGRALGSQEVNRLQEASGGNPLFVVEMVQAGYLAHAPDAEANGEEIDGVKRLPPKIVAVIQSRLAQLTPVASRVAALAATIGRAFDLELLAAASDDEEAAIVTGLDELWRRRIVREQSANLYDFSHDRIREVAYADISPVYRQRLHRRLASALQDRYVDELETVSGQIASHFEQAGLLEEAISWYRRVAEDGWKLSAFRDANRYARSALALLDALPEDENRKRLRVSFLHLLNQATAALYGSADPRSVDTLHLALELSKSTGDGSLIRTSVIQLMAFHHSRGEYDRYDKLRQEYRSLLQESEDVVRQTGSLRGPSARSLSYGDFLDARRKIDQGLELLAQSSEPLNEHARMVAANLTSWGAVPTWILGYPDRARSELQQDLDLDGPAADMALLVRAFMASMVHLNSGDLETLARQIDNTFSLAEKHDLFLAHTGWRFFRGWEWASRGRLEEGIALSKEGIDMLRSAGHMLFHTYRLATLCEMYMMAGDLPQAQSLLDEAFTVVRDLGQRFWSAELHRLKGTIRLARQNEAGAERSYLNAIDIAQAQSAKSLELRAMMALCRLWQKQGKTQPAYARLSALYAWFTEGYDTRDLKEAKTLLDELR